MKTRTFGLVLMAVPAYGHGHMTSPPSRNGGTLARAGDCLHGECMFFSQPSAIPGEPTLNDAPLRTFNVDVSSGPTDFTRRNPWRAPGSAPVLGTGCGRAGGGPVRSYNGGTAKEFGLVQNQDGAELPRAPAATWQRGSTVEVAWAINANHGGGYQYRLCPAGQPPTEACFQRTPLPFAAAPTQWLEWTQTWGGNHTQTRRVAIPRVTVAVGTVPAGSAWARVPIPGCRFTGDEKGLRPACPGDCAGCCATTTPPAHPRINASWWRAQDCIASCAGSNLPACPAGHTQFPEPLPGLALLWNGWTWCEAPPRNGSTDGAAAGGRGIVGDSPHDLPCSNSSMLATNIIDRVEVPAGLAPGEYVVSWRWDVEQTEQVWQNCGDVVITA